MIQTPSAELDLTSDVAHLTAVLLDIESVSGDERGIADAIERALRPLAHLEVVRDGDCVMARTSLGRSERVILAGHIDTVPLPSTAGSRGTVPSVWDGEVLFGRGATDMKGGVAVQLALASALTEPTRDITYVFYDHEEVEASLSGLGRVADSHPDWLVADFAVLLEPTDGTVEGGCNGTARFEVRTAGKASHSARAWMGVNAIHGAAEVLVRLRDHEPATVHVDGLDYRESLNAVKIVGGTAGNVIPDSAVIEVNYRFAPDKGPEQAEEYVRQLLEGFDVRRTDVAAGARPGLQHPAAAAFVAAVGADPKPKYGWTDVARFSALGIPAVNFGPGDALLAHTDDEHVHADAVRACLRALVTWLS
ncbi:succinyl-diaminopimelate desuccinylase [Arthrobacter agilis]|uniref:succinyl-diaminopimelate desuccinylase n=1 Tax=Arthrobacter agilis TaxID=37921 RepID=UPI000B35B101|nr:succinyl-diaminopimelate desuccinylase [Arthrobacter agilis]OUM41387.1 succinyl-diaminopimelate desuccinylase [Arthrobacter agilis]PPB46281.1 succinyl-diaminopimelate desuccinylase [Arthrobacter agilis]TPV27038.1 succinyl-diaminopimelate desuccinylase [Arthrobacter agilis]WDF32488.1 succinyl-diaminopimelate desuccinylase [Arthrobacter agilis]VDR32814.1 Succinyl-diaminopimelate desuccinylase [Arthrobacter agilis]